MTGRANKTGGFNDCMSSTFMTVSRIQLRQSISFDIEFRIWYFAKKSLTASIVRYDLRPSIEQIGIVAVESAGIVNQTIVIYEHVPQP